MNSFSFSSSAVHCMRSFSRNGMPAMSRPMWLRLRKYRFLCAVSLQGIKLFYTFIVYTNFLLIKIFSFFLEQVHSHKKRTTHQAQPLQVPADYAALQEHCVIPRMYMELFAVVCIATSHYVAFVKCGPGPDAPWCFFDSMADRKGEQNGFNIPEVITCPDLPRWLSDEWDKQLLSNSSDTSSSSNPPGTGLPDYVRRLFSDAYMCLYQSPDLMLYR